MEAFFDVGPCPNSMMKTQKRRVVMKARHYTKIGEDLMVFGKDGVLRRFLSKKKSGSYCVNAMTRVDIKARIKLCFSSREQVFGGLH